MSQAKRVGRVSEVAAPSRPVETQQDEARPATMAMVAVPGLARPTGPAAHAAAPPAQSGGAAEPNPMAALRRMAARSDVRQEAPDLVKRALSGSGRPLPERTRSTMEGFFGQDLSRVRVHDGPAAAQSAAAVSAQAYTVGSDIVFNTGRYAPDTRAGQSLLAHELTHTLQPASSGASSGADGIRVSDPGDRDEVEAAQVARAFDAGAEHACLGEHGHIADRLARSVDVRRAVGLEFETGWKVTDTSGPAPRHLVKKEKIGPVWDGFKLEADEAGGGEAEIEFIVHPPIDEGPVGFGRIDAVMTQVQQLGERMEQVAAGNGGTPFTMDQASLRVADSAFTVAPTADKKLAAGPQVTTGLDLAKMSSLATSEKLAPTPSEQAGLIPDEGPAVIPDELRASMGALSDQAAAMKGTPLIPKPSEHLRGLLAVITNYLDAGADRKKGQDVGPELRTQLALNYPKRIADVLLARTNFAVLFGLLPGHERKRLEADGAGWVALVLTNTDPDRGLAAGDSVIGRGIQNDENDPSQGITVPALTINAWLLGMLVERDELTGVEDAESMGEFDHTEEVGSGLFAFEAGIFEFRGAQTRKIPLARWGPFAREFHQYISHLHSS